MGLVGCVYSMWWDVTVSVVRRLCALPALLSVMVVSYALVRSFTDCRSSFLHAPHFFCVGVVIFRIGRVAGSLVRLMGRLMESTEHGALAGKWLFYMSCLQRRHSSRSGSRISGVVRSSWLKMVQVQISTSLILSTSSRIPAEKRDRFILSCSHLDISRR